jgi:hypothetical protein
MKRYLKFRDAAKVPEVAATSAFFNAAPKVQTTFAAA